jgi:hypothetical protein
LNTRARPGKSMAFGIEEPRPSCVASNLYCLLVISRCKAERKEIARNGRRTEHRV